MSSIQPRIDHGTFRNMAPGIYAALLAIGQEVEAAGLDRGLLELVKLRASQINGCAFCLGYHLNAARKLGVAQTRLDLLAAWHDAAIFSETERAALAWTEAVTNLTAHGAPDAAYDAVRAHFTEAETVFLTVQIGLINNWNRIGVALRFAPPAAA